MKQDQLVSLDLLITHTKNDFKTSVYHKPTFTGQYLTSITTILGHHGYEYYIDAIKKECGKPSNNSIKFQALGSRFRTSHSIVA